MRVFDGRKGSCGICGESLGRVYFWNRELRIWLCPYCAEEFDPSDLVIHFDFRKRPRGFLIQGLNYLKV